MPSVDPSIAREPFGATVIADGLRWWLDELRALGAELGAATRLTAPSAVTIEITDMGWLVARETGAAHAVLGSIDADRLSDAMLRDALTRLLPRAKREPVALLLPPSAVLTRVVRLPAAALGDLTPILDFEIGRHTPFTAD